MKVRLVLAIVIIQSFLCLAHWFMFRTWVDFWGPMTPPAAHALQIAFAVLSLIFVTASLLSFRFFNPAVRLFYRVAALWLGVANFLFVGAWTAWLVDLVLRFAVSTTTRIADRPVYRRISTAAVDRNRDIRPGERSHDSSAAHHGGVAESAAELAWSSGFACFRRPPRACQSDWICAPNCGDGARIESCDYLSGRRSVRRQ